MRCENICLEINTIWDAFFNNFAIFSIFEKNQGFLSKRPISFSIKPQILDVLWTYNTVVAFYGNFATILWKQRFTMTNVNKFGQHQLAWLQFENIG